MVKFWFWYFKYILVINYFYWSNVLKAGLLLVVVVASQLLHKKIIWTLLKPPRFYPIPRIIEQKCLYENCKRCKNRFGETLVWNTTKKLHLAGTLQVWLCFVSLWSSLSSIFPSADSGHQTASCLTGISVVCNHGNSLTMAHIIHRLPLIKLQFISVWKCLVLLFDMLT